MVQGALSAEGCYCLSEAASSRLTRH